MAGFYGAFDKAVFVQLIKWIDKMAQKSFLESEYQPATEDNAAFWVIPCPLEKTVSYGKGTAMGPQAILEASQELEAIENEIAPGEAGILTCPPVNCDGSVENVLGRISMIVEKALKHSAIPVLLGGEHTISLGALRALKYWYAKKGEKFGVVQFDAHADMRDEYKGERISHATVMRRVMEELDLPFVQFAARDISKEELKFREEHKVTHYDAYFMARVGLPQQPLPEDFPKNIYISFDLDALDSSLMPATGTPSPGGINWKEAQFILESCVYEHNLIGMDIVELAPIAALHHADFTAAKLVHLLMALAWGLRSEKK